MRASGSGKSFIATAAVLMASLVIVTILAINIRLQSALTTAPSTPRVKSGTSSAPALQNTATPLVDIVSPSAPAVDVPGVASAPASEVSTGSAPGAQTAPKGNVAAPPPQTGALSVVPDLSVTISAPTPTVPSPSGVTATTTSTAVSPAPSSDIGDTTASSGEDGHHKAGTGGLTPLVSASAPPGSPHN